MADFGVGIIEKQKTKRKKKTANFRALHRATHRLLEAHFVRGGCFKLHTSATIVDFPLLAEWVSTHILKQYIACDFKNPQLAL
jgi:hypothetical protein